MAEQDFAEGSNLCLDMSQTYSKASIIQLHRQIATLESELSQAKKEIEAIKAANQFLLQTFAASVRSSHQQDQQEHTMPPCGKFHQELDENTHPKPSILENSLTNESSAKSSSEPKVQVDLLSDSTNKPELEDEFVLKPISPIPQVVKEDKPTKPTFRKSSDIPRPIPEFIHFFVNSKEKVESPEHKRYTDQSLVKPEPSTSKEEMKYPPRQFKTYYSGRGRRHYTDLDHPLNVIPSHHRYHHHNHHHHMQSRRKVDYSDLYDDCTVQDEPRDTLMLEIPPPNVTDSGAEKVAEAKVTLSEKSKVKQIAEEHDTANIPNSTATTTTSNDMAEALSSKLTKFCLITDDLPLENDQDGSSNNDSMQKPLQPLILNSSDGGFEDRDMDLEEGEIVGQD